MSMAVELLRAWPHRHESRALRLPAGSTAADALLAAGWIIDAAHPALAIHGQRVPPGHVLADGDRIELLRPLAMDPKQARRLRAERAAQRRGAG